MNQWPVNLNEFRDLLHGLFSYNPKTGQVIARKQVRGRRAKGSVVGCLYSNGYLVVMVLGKQYGLHRLIWLMQTGEWPNQIDHVNHNKVDNAWDNLRSVSQKENQRNKPISKRNKSGIVGVRWRPNKRQWCASITFDGQYYGLYCGHNFFEACCRRKSAELALGFHSNHGVTI